MSPVKSPEKLGARDAGNKNKIVVQKDEAEELLPGWTKEVKIRKTGSATKVDRYYTDPVTGYVFRSLKDVQRYLKTGELGRLAIKPKTEKGQETGESKEQMTDTLRHKRAPTDKSESPARASKRLAGINIDEPLPSPSPPQPKTRQATRLAGNKVDALSLSMPEPKTRQATLIGGVAVDASLPSPPEAKTRQAKQPAEVAADASLPSPSLPEPKTRQAKQQAKVTVDASLQSPSPPEPKTRQAKQQAEVTVYASLQSPSTPKPKTRQATRLTVYAPPASPPKHKAHQTIKLAEVAVVASSPDNSTAHEATRQSGTKLDASVQSQSPAVPKTRRATRQAGIKIDSPPPLPPDSKTRQATPLTGTEIRPSPPSQPEPKTRQAKRLSGSRDNASSPQPKTRRATQQAEIKNNSPPPSPPSTRTSHQATQTRPVNPATPIENNRKTEAEKITDKHDENADMDSNPNNNQESNTATRKEHHKKLETGPTSSLAPEDQALPTVAAPPVSLQKQESPVVNPTVSNPTPQDSCGYGTDMKPDSSINFSMNDLWTDPCIEFAVKTLTGAIPVTDLNKVENFSAPVEVPPQEIWTDPCIEFAVKTLTGAIPVGEDDYLLHRPASSTNPQGQHQFSSPDVLLKHYETGLKNKQQDAVFPSLGNGGLQNSGKFVNWSNGQGSRPRFFQ